ncbi:hypothetical protein [Janibacter melonis]|uniref:hypothetical protein n=1 Tax=Janibacter melonis TaxID=262209 RepID=UPI002095C2B1|nr:hypothetical protein [Janibacter melonis]
MRLLLASLLVGLGVLVGAPTAQGVPCSQTCSCVLGTPQQQARGADVLAVVTVSDVALPSGGGAGYAFYRLEVDQRLGGDVSRTATVRAYTVSDGCGALLTTLCSGTRRATPSLVLAVTGSVVLTALR